MKYCLVFLVAFLLPLSLFSYSSDAYLVEIGKVYFKSDSFNDAKLEFTKALIINPANKQAKKYLELIHKKRVKDALKLFSQEEEEEVVIVEKKKTYLQKKEVSSSEEVSPILPKQPLKKENSQIELKGQYQFGFGIEKKDFLWKKANFDLNEENWRILSDGAYNRRENTYDPGIYSQLKLQLDYPKKEGWGFHSNFDISPWSFIGKSDKVTVNSAFGDTAEVQLKYWANTRYTIGESVYSNLLGNSFALPEVKVVDGKILSFNVSGAFWPADTFTIPELKIKREFWPLRELWFDYNQDNFNLKIFPVAMFDAAYTSDDPLTLSNRKIFWEESQWLTKWSPGHFNSGAGVQDFFKGWWDDSLAFFTRDSTGALLTSLRGFSLGFDNETDFLDFTLASPKELWQDYSSLNSWASALRGKHIFLDNFSLGFIYGSKLGYNERSLDAFNHVLGFDLNYGLTPQTEILMETAASRSEYDRTSSYETEKRGNAFHVSLINSSEDIFGKDYFGINPPRQGVFYKTRLSLTHMDEGFESALSSYRQTRDDTFWGRHLTFRKPFQFYFTGLYYPSLTWDDIKTFKIGDGVDYGRDVINFRWEIENLLENRLGALFDLRNVHNADGKYIENVSRVEAIYKANEKLTAKFLGIHHDLPKTKAGVDPFIIDAQTGLPLADWSTTPVTTPPDGADPSLKTISLGAEYWIWDWLGVDGIWEYTNDYTLAYDNFPRGILNSSELSRTYTEEGQQFRDKQPFVYSQHYFPQPPYSWYDIFKVGFRIKPNDKLNIYLDWTRNEYEWAQIIDDNMNHTGLEVEYLPFEKLGFYFRYVYSRCKDISELANDTRVAKRSHHNLFNEVRLRLEENSELVAQYGVGSFAGMETVSYTPFGGGVAVLDTQHIFRLYYRKKF
ncbi:MAG: hypothetical protein ABIK26_07210 [Candidatus Omnitrophota bacterium]